MSDITERAFYDEPCSTDNSSELSYLGDDIIILYTSDELFTNKGSMWCGSFIYIICDFSSKLYRYDESKRCVLVPICSIMTRRTGIKCIEYDGSCLKHYTKKNKIPEEGKLYLLEHGI